MTRRGALWPAGAALLASVLPTAAQEKAGVTVHAVDPFGNGLGPVQVTQFVEKRVGGRDYAGWFVGPRATGIPYGTYFAHIRAGGAGIAGDVSVDREDVFVVLAAFRGATEVFPLVAGKLSGLTAASQRPIWVKLVKIYGETDSYTALVDADGSFATGVSSSGAYLILVLRDGGVLYSGTVRVDELGVDMEVNITDGTLKSTTRGNFPR